MARFVAKNGYVHKHEDHLRFHSENNWEGLYIYIYVCVFSNKVK